MNQKLQLRYPVLFVPTLIFVVVIVFGIIFEEKFAKTLSSLFESLMWNFGWIVSLTMLLFVAFMLVVIFHPIGNIRLGGPNAKPKMTYWQWFVVSLCAGIGTGVVFWGAVEPLLFTMEPAPSLGLKPGSNQALMWGMRTTFLHWTLTPYAIYVSFGLILAYVCHNMRRPFNVSSGLVPLVGDRAINSRLGTVIDVLTVFALVGGVAGSLGYGILQLGKGVEILYGFKPSVFLYIMIGVLICAAYTATSISGLQKGILWLGDKNAWFFLMLLAYLLLFGPASYIANLFVQSLGSYVGNFIEGMTFTSPFPDSKYWPQWWDQYWWVDWLSYGPIMGLFFVRLGYGRTLREFVVVNWLMPSIFGFVWFTIFGGTVLHAQFYEGIDYYATYKTLGAEAMTLEAFNQVPLAMLVKPFMLIVIAISFITLANSMIATIASMTMHGVKESEEAHFSLKLVWGVLILAASLLFTLTGGIDGIKMVKTFAGFPIVFVGLAMVWGFARHMSKRPRDQHRNYVYEDEVANAPNLDTPVAPRSQAWIRFTAWISGLVAPKDGSGKSGGKEAD